MIKRPKELYVYIFFSSFNSPICDQCAIISIHPRLHRLINSLFLSFAHTYNMTCLPFIHCSVQFSLYNDMVVRRCTVPTLTSKAKS